MAEKQLIPVRLIAAKTHARKTGHMSLFEIIITVAVAALSIIFLFNLCSLITVARKITEILEMHTRLVADLHREVQDLRERVLAIEDGEHQTEEPD